MVSRLCLTELLRAKSARPVTPPVRVAAHAGAVRRTESAAACAACSADDIRSSGCRSRAATPAGNATAGRSAADPGAGAPSEGLSQPAPASVLAEVARQLFGRCPPAQRFDVLAFEERLAIQGILKPLE